MLKNLMNMASALKQASQLGGKMEALKERLRSQRASGIAGDGAIVVEVNGLGEMPRVAIDPAIWDRAGRETLESMLPEAVNQALGQAKQMHVDAMKSLTDGLDLPGLNDALAKFAS